MSQTPPRPSKEDRAVAEITAIVSRPPVIRFGAFERPPVNYSQMCDATKAMLRLLRSGSQSVQLDYATRKDARAAAHNLCAYRRHNGTPVIISQLDNTITIWPKK